ncbi:DNA repair protein XRCC4 [Diospyros lotus]|uniref:DNA repair protein XRCC4 n=1 Tax=Diospyros lotus TaxID=55363 RepID=UPI00224DD9CF|nr:DNA repair protein XRCC4 [Diospyros lotus]
MSFNNQQTDTSSMEGSSSRHTCLKLEVSSQSEPDGTEPIFVKGTWFASRFELAITDGLGAWILNATEDEVRERASQWDQPVDEYIDLAERYLGFQQRGSVYAFADAGNGHRRLSWTFEKEGTKLEWRWKCKPSPNSKKTTAGVLDFLMDANIRLSDEVVMKTQSFEQLKVEAEKCLAQSERFSNEKREFEEAIYAKFLGILNLKKAKLRQLRDQLLKQEKSGKLPQAEESTDKTETYGSNTDEEKSQESSENCHGSSKDAAASKPRGRKRKQT